MVDQPVPDGRSVIHASNAWNPTGLSLRPVAGCRLYYAHVERVGGARTQVFLGDQRHLVFVADLEGHLPDTELRERVLADGGLYPHQLDLSAEPALPAPARRS